MDEVIRVGIPPSDMARYFEGLDGVVFQREEVIHVTAGGNHIVTIYPVDKFLEFSDDFEDPMSHGPRLRELVDRLRKEGYTMNLK